MNITNIELVFLNKIKEAIEEINDNNIKVTLLKKIASQSIDTALGRTAYNGLNPASISAMFSGRGRAWAKVNASEENVAWVFVKKVLSHDKKNYDLLDLFEQTGFAWMRYSSARKGQMIFDLRFRGSKVEDCVKCYIPSALINHIENLEGVPHKLGLESGDFREEVSKKKIVIDQHVTVEELSTFGIQSIESML